jgi:hypothetical protein
MLRSGSCLPLFVVCVQRCSMTVSARAFIICTIQSPARCACAVPGTRGPKATCWRVYESAESPTKAVFARAGRGRTRTSRTVRQRGDGEQGERSVRRRSIESGMSSRGAARHARRRNAGPAASYLDSAWTAVRGRRFEPPEPVGRPAFGVDVTALDATHPRTRTNPGQGYGSAVGLALTRASGRTTGRRPSRNGSLDLGRRAGGTYWLRRTLQPCANLEVPRAGRTSDTFVKIISRYILREHVGPFTFALTALTSLMILNFISRSSASWSARGFPRR